MEQLTCGDGDISTVGAEFDGIDGVLEGHPMEHSSAAKVYEEASAVLVDGEEEHSVRRGRNSGDIRRRLNR